MLCQLGGEHLARNIDALYLLGQFPYLRHNAKLRGRSKEWKVIKKRYKGRYKEKHLKFRSKLGLGESTELVDKGTR